MGKQEEGWPGAYAVVSRTDGETLTGRFIGYFRLRGAGKCLRLDCGWGTTEIPEYLVAEVHYS